MYCTYRIKGNTLYRVEIAIRPSALAHRITDDEIRTVITYPALRVRLAARRVNTAPVLFIGTSASIHWPIPTTARNEPDPKE